MPRKSLRNFLKTVYYRLAKPLNANAEMYPPGHFHSAIPCLDTLRAGEKRIWGEVPRTIANVDLREDEQLLLLSKIAEYYPELPWTSIAKPGYRYYFHNNTYCQSDAIFLYGVLRHFKPKRVIEVGSGFSTAAMLDINAEFFNNSMSLTCVEPYPERLQPLLHKNDHIELLKKRVEDVDVEIFRQLKENDILFIDSTHVLKTGSDVNHLLFNVLPALGDGVLIHFHDVFYPFEYPKEWVLGRRAWNESYALRAFLQYNNKFEIRLFNTFLEHFHEPWFAENMPTCLENYGGSIWLQTTAGIQHH